MKNKVLVSFTSCARHGQWNCLYASDVNKDWTLKDQDQDKDQTHKDKDKDKDRTLKDKDKDKDQGQTFKDKDKDWPRVIFKD